MESDLMIYLDYAASTPVDKEVIDLYYDVTFNYFANPNSNHKLGRGALKVIDDSTCEIASLLGVLEDEIIYTSGATEANNLAIKGICNRYRNYGKHIIISTLEHNSITSSVTSMQEAGFDIDLVSITKDGLVDIEALRRLIRDDTILVSICSVDSEIGLVQPIEEIARLLKKYPHTYFHTDASQAIGKVQIDYSDVDLITIAPHKFYGLPGTGVLVKKKNVSLKPLIEGGKSTTLFRSGTPVVGEIAAVSKALSLAISMQSERYDYVKRLNDIIREHLSGYENIYINSTKNSLPFTLNFSIKNVKALKFAKMLEDRGVYISTKTSCCPLYTPSKLVYALTRDKSLASTSLRLSLSHLTSFKEIEEFLQIFDECMKEL